MKFTFYHFNFNVLDLERSIRFYDEALGLKPVREKASEDGSYKLVFLGDGETGFQLELTWLRDHKEPYDLGEGEIHLAMRVDDYEAARQKARGDGRRVLCERENGRLFHRRPGRLLDRGPAREEMSKSLGKPGLFACIWNIRLL